MSPAPCNARGALGGNLDALFGDVRRALGGNPAYLYALLGEAHARLRGGSGHRLGVSRGLPLQRLPLLVGLVLKPLQLFADNAEEHGQHAQTQDYVTHTKYLSRI